MQLRPYEYSYFQPTRPQLGKLASTFTDVECFLWQGAGPATSWLTATQDSETATTGTWTECRAARDGSGTVPTLSGDLRGGELCVTTRKWSNKSEDRFSSRPERVKLCTDTARYRWRYSKIPYFVYSDYYTLQSTLYRSHGGHEPSHDARATSTKTALS